MSCARLPRCLAHGGVREFGCGVTSRHARRCCRNRGGLLRKQKACGKCDALRTTDNRPLGGAARPLILCCLLLSVLETIERNESDESGILGTIRFSSFRPWLAGRGFALS